MGAELVVVSGPLLGRRFPVADAPVEIGRSPQSIIQLAIPEAAQRHCTVRRDGDAFLLLDHRTAHGTYVNGLKCDRCELADGDQFSIGDTVLLFRSSDSPEPVPQSIETILLRACSLQFLVKALATAPDDILRAPIATQLARLFSDLLPVADGAVWLEGEGGGALQARVAAEGPLVDEASRTLAVPLYVRGRMRGILTLRFDAATGRIAGYKDAAAALATLAASALEAVEDVERLRTENAILLERTEGDRLVAGASPAMRKLLEMVERVAPLDTSVLLLGESGTGKEVIARALHRQSLRCEQPFVAINCAALTDTLLESELFGHEKGAFTGAVAQKKGKLEMAEGGTVFLDEIGELAQPLQAKLLRVLQEREFERVGGTRTQRLDVRLIAATNRDLAAEAKRGAFREDLYHRLNVVALRTPPLRQRREDIPELASYFLQRSAARCRRRVTAISAEALRQMVDYDWPGNVRELENAIERAVVLGNTELLEPDDLPETIAAQPAAAAFAGDPLVEAKRAAIVRAWGEARGDYKQAATLLGVHPNSLLRMIRTLGLRESLG